MFRVYSAFLMLIPALSWSACEELEGLWEGYQFQNSLHAPHILEIDADCTGFYAYSLGEAESETFVLRIDPDDALKHGQSYFVVQRSKDDWHNQAILVPEPGPVISVITSGTYGDRTVYAITWKLTKVRTAPRNHRLYQFAKDAL